MILLNIIGGKTFSIADRKKSLRKKMYVNPSNILSCIDKQDGTYIVELIDRDFDSLTVVDYVVEDIEFKEHYEHNVFINLSIIKDTLGRKNYNVTINSSNISRVLGINGNIDDSVSIVDMVRYDSIPLKLTVALSPEEIVEMINSEINYKNKIIDISGTESIIVSGIEEFGDKPIIQVSSLDEDNILRYKDCEIIDNKDGSYLVSWGYIATEGFIIIS